MSHSNVVLTLRKIEDDINYSQSELNQLEVLLDQFLSNFDEKDTQISRKIRSLECQIEVKMTLLDTLKKRKHAIETKNQVIASLIPTEEENVGLNHDGSSSHSFFCSESAVCSQANSPNPKKSFISPKRSKMSIPSVDDANIAFYRNRVRLYHRAQLRDEQLALEHEDPIEPKPNDVIIEGGLTVPGDIWCRLYDYQRLGIRWLWGLHQHGTGGILGDEMGLGKTVQIIAFLAALRHSRLSVTGGCFELSVSRMKPHDKSFHESRMIGLGPVLIVCPATVLNQWLCEFRSWLPTSRVVILHSSGSGYANPDQLIRSLFSTSGFLITTYATLTLHKDLLTPLAWHYLILDEGHKIKNPDADITTCVKRFSTPHRLIVSGTPMQNNLKELWSLFDFINPGKLSSLPDFLQNFAVPIVQGGYANSTTLQVEIAYRCACSLRNLLSPFLLRRLKAEVNIELPNKSEQVLFCRLTNYQRCVYEEYLSSKACSDLLNGQGFVFKGLILLKALCNHPDLVTGGPKMFGMRYGEEKCDDLSIEDTSPWSSFGCARRSGKLVVTLDLLQLWRSQGNKVLLFSQSRRMLKLLERHVSSLGYSFLRMDGSTPVTQRQHLVTLFNAGDYFVFLLTTRVGGVGVNLTAANRVIIYDPDWNPSTDAQARERAWRIGQMRDVIIYRLLTSGTIEEKVYQRQIFKQFLTNRVLKNPHQQRFFKMNNLHELFSLDDEISSKNNDSESLSLFRICGAGSSISQPLSFKSKSDTDIDNRFDRLLVGAPSNIPDSIDSDEEQIGTSFREDLQDLHILETESDREKRLRALAKHLSRKLTEVSAVNPDIKQNHHHKAHKRKLGTRVDGHRIRLVDKRSDFDEGHELYKRRRENTEQEPLMMDQFVSSVLSQRGDGNISSFSSFDDTLSHFRRKRSEVDEQITHEAMLVASTALEHIGQSSSMSQISSLPKITKGLMNNLKHSPSASARRQSSILNSKYNAAKISSSLPPSSTLRGITAVNHDQLMNDFLLSTQSIDSSLTKLHVDRVTGRVINWLKLRASEFDRISITSTLSTSMQTSRFGRLKNRFLWSDQEDSSPVWNHCASFNGTIRDTCLYQRSSSGSLKLGLLFTGHNRLSSYPLLQLIRTRREQNSKLVGLSAGNDSEEFELRRLSLRLLRLFTERQLKPSYSRSPCQLIATTAEISAQFPEIVTFDGKKLPDSSLLPKNFRALLRSFATLHGDYQRQRNRERDLWVLKPEFVIVARRLALFPDNFSPSECT